MGGRDGGARRPRPAALRRAGHRRRPSAPRRGRGPDRRAGRAGLRRAGRRRTRGPPRRVARLRPGHRGRRRSPFPNPWAAAPETFRSAGEAATPARAPARLHSQRDETICPANAPLRVRPPARPATSPATSGGAGTCPASTSTWSMPEARIDSVRVRPGAMVKDQMPGRRTRPGTCRSPGGRRPWRRRRRHPNRPEPAGAGGVVKAASESMLTSRPSPRSSIWGRTSWMSSMGWR